ncbi:hypothetical protein Tco_1217384 [Tanacetum coccineum]
MQKGSSKEFPRTQGSKTQDVTKSDPQFNDYPLGGDYVALQIVNDCPELAATMSLLEVFARKPDAFATLEKNIVMRIIVLVQPTIKKDTDALKLLNIIWRCVCDTMHIDKIEDILKGPPRILFVANEDGLTIFHIAVMHRHQGGNCYSHIRQLGIRQN